MSLRGLSAVRGTRLLAVDGASVASLSVTDTRECAAESSPCDNEASGDAECGDRGKGDARDRVDVGEGCAKSLSLSSSSLLGR